MEMNARRLQDEGIIVQCEMGMVMVQILSGLHVKECSPIVAKKKCRDAK